MKEDSRHSSWALNDPVSSNEDIDRKFGDLSYSKGGAVIRMMESFLGSATMAAGLSSYLQELVGGDHHAPHHTVNPLRRRTARPPNWTCSPTWRPQGWRAGRGRRADCRTWPSS